MNPGWIVLIILLLAILVPGLLLPHADDEIGYPPEDLTDDKEERG